ncbi:pilus assembly FimT family protein [Halomonas sp. SH5A2]|uniref:pilus assembly FimT family protein n=1 Tax=Halomonas sp. SH5A2 TaxID=2749040 RepID=UPI001F0A92B2|nr:GspH/FimT family pseudopilin [Halomonas sp. SH5A2]
MHQRGFTLIELMIVLAIAALLMLLAAPAFSTFMARQQLAGDVNQLQSVLTFARSEAIKQRQPITVTFSPPNTATSTRRPDECLDNDPIEDDSDDGPSYLYAGAWCYWAENSQDDGESSVMRAGQTANIAQPKDNFSIVFESLGDADISDCADVDGQCVIMLVQADSGDDIAPVTITVRKTGSLHKDTIQ